MISDDIGNRIRAKHYGINAIKLPLELRLPDEPDPNELKIRELEKENLKLKMKVPKPLIVFGNEKKYFDIASKVGMRKFLFSSFKETLHSTLVISNGIETVAL